MSDKYYIEQDIVDGKMHRICGKCKTDVTIVTMYSNLNYCPYCGRKLYGMVDK